MIDIYSGNEQFECDYECNLLQNEQPHCFMMFYAHAPYRINAYQDHLLAIE